MKKKRTLNQLEKEENKILKIHTEKLGLIPLNELNETFITTLPEFLPKEWSIKIRNGKAHIKSKRNDFIVYLSINMNIGNGVLFAKYDLNKDRKVTKQAGKKIKSVVILMNKVYWGKDYSKELKKFLGNGKGEE